MVSIYCLIIHYASVQYQIPSSLLQKLRENQKAKRSLSTHQWDMEIEEMMNCVSVFRLLEVKKLDHYVVLRWIIRRLTHLRPHYDKEVTHDVLLQLAQLGLQDVNATNCNWDWDGAVNCLPPSQSQPSAATLATNGAATSTMTPSLCCTAEHQQPPQCC